MVYCTCHYGLNVVFATGIKFSTTCLMSRYTKQEKFKLIELLILYRFSAWKKIECVERWKGEQE
jgi:hypothetical protein